MESNTQVDDANKVKLMMTMHKVLTVLIRRLSQGTASFTIPVVTSGNVPS
jgi:hypothetical protein